MTVGLEKLSIFSQQVAVSETAQDRTNVIVNKKAVLSQGNRAMPQLFYSV